MIWPFSILERPKVGAISRYNAWTDIFDTGTTASGIPINNESALNISTVYACIRNIAEDVAKVPFKVYRKSDDKKEVIPDHPLFDLLNRKSSEDYTAMSFRQTMTAHCLGWGNAYAEIQRFAGGQVSELQIIHPSKVKVEVNDSGDVVYTVTTETGQQVHVASANMFHIKGLGADGIVGYNVIQYARENFGASKAAETFGATYFGNNTVLGGILKHPTNLSPEAQQRLRDSVKKFQGPENANKVMILEEAMDYTMPVIPPEQSQFLETRQFSIPEVCRWFRMPPHKVHDLTRATFSNIEHQDLEYVKDCLTAWFKRWETEVWSQLLSEVDQNTGVFVEHTVEGLLRGDINSRYGAYQIALGNNNNPGFMTINEVRSLENLNPISGGDDLLSPQEPVEEPIEENEELQPDN